MQKNLLTKFNTLHNVGIEEIHLNVIKAACVKPPANLIFNGEKLKAFLLSSITSPLLPILFSIVLEVLAMKIREEKERKATQIVKEVKVSLFADDMTLYIENFKHATRKLLELVNELDKVSGYKINT